LSEFSYFAFEQVLITLIFSSSLLLEVICLSFKFSIFKFSDSGSISGMESTDDSLRALVFRRVMGAALISFFFLVK